MNSSSPRSARRADALSRERVVTAAVEILDAGGEGALTFRALAARLATGAGALYWHVSGKDELLTAATGEVIGRAAGLSPADSPPASGPGAMGPREAIQHIALAVYDAIDAHPWAGSQLAREPWQPAMLAILEAFGGQIQALGVPGRAQFDCASALVNHVLGLAGQRAAAARLARGTDRAGFLDSIARQWGQLSPAQYPFTRQAAAALPGHDDREQFLAGISLLLTGISAVR